MVNRRRPSSFSLCQRVLVLACVGLLGTTLAATPVTAQSVGVFADPDCTSCEIELVLGVPTSIYIAAQTGGDVTGMTAAELAIDPLPPEVIPLAVTPLPSGMVCLDGNTPFTGDGSGLDGDACGWAECLDGCIPLFEVLVLPIIPVSDVILQVREFEITSDPTCGSPVVADCTGQLACAAGGQAIIDPTAPGTFDCLPGAIGACCLPDGMCAELTAAECSAFNGDYLGDGTGCSTAICVGACCLPGGVCELFLPREVCEGIGGDYQGHGTLCDPNPCEQPIGACCFPDGACAELTATECSAFNGDYLGDGTECSTAICVGACCLPGGVCEPFLPREVCEGIGGDYQGHGTLCDPNPCEQPIGACCFPDGGCQEMIVADCDAVGGVYQGDGTGCDPNPCLGTICDTDGLRTYTLDADFDTGTLVNVNHDIPDQLQLNNITEPFPFIWVAASSRGTIVKIDTVTGQILGEYWSSPDGRGRNPSRTTVDLDGAVWCGNRDEAGGGMGSVVQVALAEAGNCEDRNNNGTIETSTGLGDIRPWLNPGGIDDNGGVSSAQDECIIKYVRVAGDNVRHVSVDANNDVWVGGYTDNQFDLLDGDTGAVLAGFNVGLGGYGGLVDGNAVLWASSRNPLGLLRYDTKGTTTTADDTWSSILLDNHYGLGIDPSGNIWHSQWILNSIVKIDPTGTVFAGFPKTTGGASNDRGVAVTPSDGHVWVANSGGSDVSRLDNNGNVLKVIPLTLAPDVGVTPTGVAVDAAGKVWVTNLGSDNVMRIDPNGGGDNLGAVDLTVDLGAGAGPYNYSDMTGIVILQSAREGSWTVEVDAGLAGAVWRNVTWNTEDCADPHEPPDTSLTVEVRAAETLAGLGAATYVEVDNGVEFAGVVGQFIQVRVTFMGASDPFRTPVLCDLTVEANCPPECDADGPYLEECTGATTSVDLDGTGSTDPNGDPLAFFWSTDCPGGTFTPDNTSPTPTLTLDSIAPCPLTCNVTLEVDDGYGGVAQCSTTVTVEDTEPPTIVADAIAGEVDDACEYLMPFAAIVEDNCCVRPDDVTVDVSLLTGNATLGVPDIIKVQVGATRVEVSGTVLVSDLTSCPATVQVTVSALDCCGRGGENLVVAVAPALPIPDNNAGGVSDTITVGPSFAIEDVNVDLQLTHSWVGDLCVTVEHGGTEVRLIQRMGSDSLECAPDTCCGCAADNLDIILDDEGVGGPINYICQDNLISPPNYMPEEPLNAFDGMDSSGAWTITVADYAGLDVGMLDGWSLHIRGGAPVTTTVTADVVDLIAPEIICPDPITLERGDKICDTAVQDWLDGATATDNCDADVEIVDDSAANGFDCGFPFDSTTTVTWTATDDCGNSTSCSSEITIKPAKRVDVSQKGSLLVYPKIEIKWDAFGTVTQDTFVTMANDYPDDVFVQWYFVNGDEPLGALYAGDPPDLVDREHPGWNWMDHTAQLTQNEPTYFSVLDGLAAGTPPFTALDPGDPPGRPDPDGVPGSRVLRGYAVAWAIDRFGHEITWNHLSGSATLVDYMQKAAWEYNAFAYQARCLPQGAEPLDCTVFDANGTCCLAEAIPGQLDLDGFQYDIGFDKLLLDFYAVGSQAFSDGGVWVMLDTDLTLLPTMMDLRQDSEGPVTTKAHFDIWNENEEGFSGTTRCVTCWDQTLLSNYELPNHFMMSVIHTDKGKARIDGDSSTVCDFSEDAPLLGVVAKILGFSGAASGRAYSGMTLVGQGEEAGWILADLVELPGTLVEPEEGDADLTTRPPAAHKRVNPGR